ncbi:MULTISPECIES: glycosyltransferase family 4 protein [Cryobacterium]|uniref:glycosyltransferase family 4 protein n=1 Tax=Cryobacterium TaxID=69578 RepID=UPI00106B451E|nr:glycosyltransferase family 4 protein [Cryobacterium sp. MDB2-10]
MAIEIEPGDSGAVHVAIIVNSYPPRLGGLESHVFQLANAVRAAGARVTVVTLDVTPSDVDEDGIRVVRLRRHVPVASVISFPAWGTARRLSILLSTTGATVVSTHTRFFPMSYVGLRAARLAGIPVIHTEHGAGFVRTPSRVIQLASRLVDLSVGRTVLRRAAAVLAVSAPVAEFVSALARRESVIFPNALRMEDWPAFADDAPPTGIAFIGRLVGGKGWEEFVDVAATLLTEPEFDGLQVHMLGDGPDRENLRTRIRSRGIDGSIHLYGHADTAVIRSVLHGSVLVNPSRLAEGFQITLLEAAASGAQIVSFPVPSVAPIRADGGPVREVRELSLQPLIDGVRDALRRPLPAMPRPVLEAHWAWASRAREYLAIVSRLHGGDTMQTPGAPTRPEDVTGRE